MSSKKTVGHLLHVEARQHGPFKALKGRGTPTCHTAIYVLADDPRRVGHRGQLDRLRHHIAERDAECVQPSPREPRLLRLDVPLRLHPREHQVGLHFSMLSIIHTSTQSISVFLDRKDFHMASQLHIILFPHLLYPFNQVAVTGSIFMTVAIAWERYVAVHYPLDYNQVSRSQSPRHD